MKTMVNSNQPLISNNFVACYPDYFVIFLYYFPFGKKKIYYNKIRSCELHSTDDLDFFEQKLWGMALSPVWWHCDMKRLMRKNYILLDANQWPLIGITMDDKDIIDIYNFIRQKIYFNQSNFANEKLIYNSSKTTSEKEIEDKKSAENLKNKQSFRDKLDQ
ncbi:unnamed protein product [Rotaria socialis]|uniref:Uncharacterized protein n=2 Tax=Rotaria socialis TaxID=392032 RepID=A0A821NLT8_9BILA|nr:unnamed protein product [Rotaria socialis]